MCVCVRMCFDVRKSQPDWLRECERILVFVVARCEGEIFEVQYLFIDQTCDGRH